MKKLILVAIFSLAAISVSAQRPGTQSKSFNISGKVIDKASKEALEYATIVFKNLKNNKISGGITNTKGNFNIKVAQGQYDISVEFISFKTIHFKNRTINKDLNLGTISLSEDGAVLDEVEIIAEKSTVEIRLDKKIYNVGKDMTVKGGSASDVLDNVPSVNVDSEGSVSLRGNENVRILIDGKPSALVGLNGTDALRNLPAEAIEKVEVITSPSARYDAEGTAGILNIILRKGKITGFNGSVNVTAGTPDMARFSPNLNYRTKKINLFTNLGYSYRNGPGNSYSYFTNLNNGTPTGYREEDRKFDRKNNNYNGSLGLEYYINKNSSITGTYFYRKSDGDDVATNITNIFDASKSLLSTDNRIENESENGNDKQFSLNYTNNFDGKGKKLTIDLQFGDSDETETANIYNNNILSELNTQTTASQDKLFQFDFVLPIGENSQFEIGHKSDLQNLNSDFRVRDGSGNVIPNDPSNAIDFKQNIYAFYTQYGNKINKFSYLLGLRAEITDIDLDLLTTTQTSNKNYTEWFPTVNLGFELNESDNITLGYSRRLRRPRHWFLNPFETRSSTTNVFRGNPDLDPTFTSSFDLGYTTRISKLNIGGSVYYQNSNNIIQQVSIIEERNINGANTNVFIRQPINLNNEQRYGVEFTSNYNPSRNVRLSASFNFFRFKTDAFDYVYTAPDNSQITTNLAEVNNSSWFTRFNARITLPAKIQWQTRLMYRGPQNSAQSDREGMFFTSISFSKDVLKDKASLVLNVNDLFNSRKRESTTYNGGRINPTSIAEQSFQWRERQISLSFTYRFNQKKNQRQRRPQQENFDDGGGEGFGK